MPDLQVDLKNFEIAQESGKKEQRTAKDEGKPGVGGGLTDFGISPEGDNQIRLAVTPADRQNAIDLPTQGWSGYGRLYNATPGKPLRGEAFRTAHQFNSDPDR